MLLQLPDFIQPIYDWFVATFPWLADLVDTIAGMIGLTLLFLIPGAGGGVAVALFIFIAVLGGLSGGIGGADFADVAPLLIPAIIAAIILGVLIILSVGTLATLWGTNELGLLLLIIILISALGPEPTAIALAIMGSLVGLGIVGKKKINKKFPEKCMTIKGKKLCVFKENG